MSRILITGGAGFIGRSLAETLLKKGNEVRIIDTASTHESFFRNTSILPGATKIQGSVLDPQVLTEAVKGCDVVAHLAARLGVKRTDTKRLACLDVNIMGTINVLEACVKTRATKVIFASSSEVYGNSLQVPITETTPLNPVSVYAASKIAGEEYVKAYAQDYGLSYTIFRFFNVYGVGQVAQFVLPRFVRSVMEGDVPTVYGDGTQTRAFCYVDDISQGITAAVDHKGAHNEVFNIGNPTEPITMADLARRVLKIANVNKEPRFVGMENSDRLVTREIQKRMPSIEKVQKVLGYQPTVTLDEGIHRLFEFGNIPESWDETLID